MSSGEYAQVAFGVWKCLICGEVFLGAEPPSRCPFCGAHKEMMVRPDQYPASNEQVPLQGLSQQEMKDLEASISTEACNVAHYEVMAKGKKTDEAVRLGLNAAFKRLTRIESEHCGVFAKLLGVKKPAEGKADQVTGTWKDDVAMSLAREKTATDLYATFAARATHPRLRQVWSALSEAERDHVLLETAILSKLQ